MTPELLHGVRGTAVDGRTGDGHRTLVVQCASFILGHAALDEDVLQGYVAVRGVVDGSAAACDHIRHGIIPVCGIVPEFRTREVSRPMRPALGVPHDVGFVIDRTSGQGFAVADLPAGHQQFGVRRIVDGTAVLLGPVHGHMRLIDDDRTLVVDGASLLAGGIAGEGTVLDVDESFVVDGPSVPLGLVEGEGGILYVEDSVHIVVDASSVEGGTAVPERSALDGEVSVVHDGPADVRLTREIAPYHGVHDDRRPVLAGILDGYGDAGAYP